MSDHLQLGDLEIEVVRKDIKNVHLSVYPPAGRVRISAPSHMKLETLRLYAISKLSWIRQQQRKILAQERDTPREYLERESHWLWGRRYLLEIEEVDAVPEVLRQHKTLILRVRPGADANKKAEVMEAWYRSQLHEKVPANIQTWEPKLHVNLARVQVRRMKTRWGSCTPAKGSILLNTELAKKPVACLEYILVHEMIHLLEPTHNERFRTLMDLHYPRWRLAREQLNRLPVRHEHWRY
ncbi:MAG: M48 family metallopeptidase [Verrucomicrobia bacterium]|nr:M48 family metallopeptidase [Verrucomicrobiota bacterium]MCH8512551.1 M48 family metallopeptidase [Kiritimatiellia bacterium]